MSDTIGVVSFSDEETAQIQRIVCVKLEDLLVAANDQTQLNRFFKPVGIAFYGSEYELADNVRRARKSKLKESSIHPLTSEKSTSVFIGVGINQGDLLSLQEPEALRYCVQATLKEIDFRLPTIKDRKVADTLQALKTMLINL
jgi:predicted nucleic acid-binding Zn ribbon protein